MAGGALKVYDQFVTQIAAAGLSVAVDLKPEDGHAHDGIYVSKSGCQGFCQMGPLLSIEPDGILYCRVKATDVPEILEGVKHGQLVERLLYKVPATGQVCKGHGDIPFYTQQHRTVLKACGALDRSGLA